MDEAFGRWSGFDTRGKREKSSMKSEKREKKNENRAGPESWRIFRVSARHGTRQNSWNPAFAEYIERWLSKYRTARRRVASKSDEWKPSENIARYFSENEKTK